MLTKTDLRDSSRVYVPVDAAFNADGIMTPFSLVWESGREYLIEKVIDIQPVKVTDAGIKGAIYTVLINGRKCTLYFERNLNPANSILGRWFVQRRKDSARS